MSKIGKKPIILSESQKIDIRKLNDENFEIKGPKGVLNFVLPRGFKLEIDSNILKVVPVDEINKKNKPLWGTLRANLANKIKGVSEGFEKVLILEGLGYSAEINNNKIYFKIGRSIPVEVEIPDNLTVEIKSEKGRSLIYVRGIDKQAVGDFAAKIRKIKPADRYHAKGFRYFNEVIKLKAVKKAGK